MRHKSRRLLLGLALLPGAAALRYAAFTWPELTELWYAQRFYPVVARLLGFVAGAVRVSLAELIVVVGAIGAVVWLGRWVTSRRDRGLARGADWRHRVVHVVIAAWVITGALALAFLLAWGLNYARPGLATRMGLETDRVDVVEVLELGQRAARLATELYAQLGADVSVPSRMRLDFAQLNDLVDRGFVAIALPGDRLGTSAVAAKRLWASTPMSYLGISGIFIPFTGEPSVNALVPDVSMPLVLAHEKAHQHGVTDEGEANLVAVMIGVASDDLYMRYAAYLYAASQLLGEAGRYDADAARLAWADLGPGPRRDLQAVREFWRRYQGPATEMARGLNDAYLRSNRVPGGVQSYGHVVRLLVGVARQGSLFDSQPQLQP